MPEINRKHIEILKTVLNASPYFSLLGMKMTEIKNGESMLELELDNKHMNPFGSAHGGVFSSVLDTAAYWAVYCGMPEDAGYTTIDLSMSNLGMAQSGKILVTGRAIKQGRSLCLSEAEARDESGRLLAAATSKMLVLQGRQSVGDLMNEQGVELPPKFL